MTAKKYKLFKPDADDICGPRPCAFFLSAQGCKNGDNCKFSHEVQKPPITIVEDDSSSAVSSEDSENEADEQTTIATSTSKKNVKVAWESPAAEKQKPVQSNNSKASTESKKKRKRIQDQEEATVDSDLGLFSKPTKRGKNNQKETNVELPPPPSKKVTPKPKQTKSENQVTDFRALNLPITPKSPTPKETKPVNDVPSFRALNLPIATFSTDGVVQTPTPKTPEKGTTPNKSKKTKSKYPLPLSTPEGKVWKNSVVATRTNPKYDSIFNYENFKRLDEESGIMKGKDWMKAKPFGPWCVNNPPAIAIDCEMCETKDPVSGKTNSKALCRLSVVNALNPDEVLIDTLVKPSWPVSDYRSRINGIKDKDLENVQFTLSHAQSFMMALCSEETVIIGHAVHNDLVAIKMEHHCNVDSALLFTCKDYPNSTCSLKDLEKTVMKKEMPNIHCSVNDARTALTCIVDGYVKRDGKPEPVERSVKINRSSNELFVHRIPKGGKSEHIKNMFLSYTNVDPEEVPDIMFGSDTGKTTVSFPSAEHANLAFKTLEGESKPDKTGRMQKRIYLRNGDYAYIRKMTMDRRKSSSNISSDRDTKSN